MSIIRGILYLFGNFSVIFRLICLQYINWCLCTFALLKLVAVLLIDKCEGQLVGGGFGSETSSCAALAQSKLYFFYGPAYSDHQIYGHNELSQLTRHENYDQNRTTILYVHGYQESAQADSVQLIVAAYNSRNDHNLIVLDWSKGASGEYFKQAVPNCASVK